ncbi:MAG: PD-(D/E)XK motif protein [Bacteroidales bacterium]|nr:PD-(D/E)XK motif protein [Bacteroidales bacterium]
METRTIFNQFKELSRSDESRVNVIDIPSLPHKLGMTSEGFPVFFIVTNTTPFNAQNIEREMLSVQYDMPCTLISDDDEQNNAYSIITLRASEVSLQSYFIEIFLMMLGKIPAIPSKRELAIEVENLISIFSALSKPPRKKVQGLWAELLVIERSLHPETLISAWHSQANAKYDFTMGRDKIEVKSTSGEERIHHFSLDQLNPSPNSRLLIASVIVRESAQGSGGMSVRDIYNKICTKVSANNARLKLYSIMAECIGSDLIKIDSIFFDYVEASDTLAFFDANQVPHVEKNSIQPFVSDVSFSSNLTHLIDISNPQSTFDRSNSPLFKSLF